MKADLESLQNELQQLYSWVTTLNRQKEDGNDRGKHEGSVFIGGK